VTQEKVQRVLRKIVEISNPRKIILFGSYVNGTTNKNSDLDVLVVARDNIGNPRKESVRIRRALRGIGMAMDILVVHEDTLDALSSTPGLIYHEAIRNGRVAYESSE
jgi:predicted nucleotidyltransferase